MDTHVNPIQDLLERSLAMVNDYKRERDAANEALEQLRPVWAHDIKLSAPANAMAEMWALVGARNQTQAMKRLRYLRSLVPENVEWGEI